MALLLQVRARRSNSGFRIYEPHFNLSIEPQRGGEFEILDCDLTFAGRVSNGSSVIRNVRFPTLFYCEHD